MSLTEDFFRPLYVEWGDAGAVLTVDGHVHAITAIDRTEGLSIEGPMQVQTTSPVASVIEADVIALGLTRDQLDRAGLTLNGASYAVTSVKRDPNPSGAGELYLYLEAA